ALAITNIRDYSWYLPDDSAEAITLRGHDEQLDRDVALRVLPRACWQAKACVAASCARRWLRHIEAVYEFDSQDREEQAQELTSWLRVLSVSIRSEERRVGKE